MAKLNLVVGSMLGAAEYVADHVANLLETGWPPDPDPQPGQAGRGTG